MEDFFEPTLDEFGEDSHATKETNVKDWCKPLQASMARLAHMQPSVCNMFLQDAASLKPPKSMTKVVQQRKQQQDLSERQGVTDRNLQPNGGPWDKRGTDSGQNSVRSLSKASAWGSNSSIPELLTRQKSQLSARPGSATRCPPRNRPNSVGKPKRPQSAQDSQSGQTDDTLKDFGIKGAKKPVDSRPPTLARSNSDAGMTSRSEMTSAASTWGYPPVRESPDPSGRESTQPSVLSPEPEPANSPCPELNMTVSNPILDQDSFLRVSQEEDKPLTPPVPESIRFSLPNMNDGSVNSDDEDDELDTERLLQQADSFVEKNSREVQEVMESLADANATIPTEGEPYHPALVMSSEHLNTSDNFDSSCPISNVAAHNSQHQSLKIRSDEGYLRNPKNNSKSTKKNQAQAPFSPHVTWSESHTVHLFQTDSMSPIGENFSPETIQNGDLENSKMRSEAASTTLLSSKGNKNDRDLRRSRNTQPKPETFRNHNKMLNMNSNNGFLLQDDASVTYKPLEVSQNGLERKGQQRPCSGKKLDTTNVVENDKPHPKAAASEADVTDKTGDKSSQLTSCLSQKSVLDYQNSELNLTQEPSRKLVPTVTLAYGDELDKKSEQSPNRVDEQGTKKKHRGRRKTFDEIETYMSKLDMEEKESQRKEMGGDPELSCACGDVPCSELLAKSKISRPGSAVRAGYGGVLGVEKMPVVKTTKTIEFCEGAPPAETVSKNELVAVREGKPERRQTGSTYEQAPVLKPSVIKRQQAKSRPVSAFRQVSISEKVAASAAATPSIRSAISRAASVPAQSEGGLAPMADLKPQAFDDDLIGGESSGLGVYESLLEEAKAMAMSSMKEAAKQPTSEEKKSGTRTKQTKDFAGKAVEAQAQTRKARPFSAPLKIASAPKKTASAVQSGSKDTVTHKYCQGHSHSSHSGIRRPQSAKPGRLINNTLSSLRGQDDDSPQMRQAQRMQMKMASMGVDIDARALERALFPPSGKSVYYDIPGNLPKNPTETLIPHYKHWLAEDYRRVMMMERRLARDDHIKYLQKVAAEKKALAKKKGKKKGKGKVATPPG